ncbi:MAG: hypothetical protein MUC35_03770 [Candidatus Margulisbacteria bacterium]|jgi:hypothetical protein|nr:hypothetical protein [Candidatus Margulisiibacteriota bacterium]
MPYQLQRAKPIRSELGRYRFSRQPVVHRFALTAKPGAAAPALEKVYALVHEKTSAVKGDVMLALDRSHLPLELEELLREKKLVTEMRHLKHLVMCSHLVYGKNQALINGVVLEVLQGENNPFSVRAIDALSSLVYWHPFMGEKAENGPSRFISSLDATVFLNCLSDQRQWQTVEQLGSTLTYFIGFNKALAALNLARGEQGVFKQRDIYAELYRQAHFPNPLLPQVAK